MSTCKLHRTVSGIFEGLAAAILLMTLLFNFTGAPDFRFVFTALGAEPWGRIATGLLELLAACLLLRDRQAVFGALLSLGLMSGALCCHFTTLGIVVRDDGGLLFALAGTVLGASAIILWLRRCELLHLGTRLFSAFRSDRTEAAAKS